MATVVFDHVLEPVDGGQIQVVRKVAMHGGTAPLMLLFAPTMRRDIAESVAARQRRLSAQATAPWERHAAPCRTDSGEAPFAE